MKCYHCDNQGEPNFTDFENKPVFICNSCIAEGTEQMAADQRRSMNVLREANHQGQFNKAIGRYFISIWHLEQEARRLREQQ